MGERGAPLDPPSELSLGEREERICGCDCTASVNQPKAVSLRILGGRLSFFVGPGPHTRSKITSNDDKEAHECGDKEAKRLMNVETVSCMCQHSLLYSTLRLGE